MSRKFVWILVGALMLSISCKQSPPSETTEADFNQIIDEIVDIYQPVFKEQGLSLVADKMWLSDVLNAFAHREKNIAFITMHGGLARNTYMSNDSLAFVVCHEIGHHQGGYPYYGDEYGPPDWASVEGQADHFAANKCLKQYFAGKDNQAYVARLENIEPKLIENCHTNYNDQEEIAICIRTTLASKGFASFQASVTSQKFPTLSVKLKPFNRSYRDGVLDRHPLAACRYQTVNAGVLCPKNFDLPSIFLGANDGYCIRGEDEIGFRHECWFNPAKSDQYRVRTLADLPVCLRNNYTSVEHRRIKEL